MGPRAGLNRCAKSRPQPGFDPRTVQPVAVSIQTELSGPRKAAICEKNSTPVYSIDFDVSTAAKHSYLTHPYTTDNHGTHSHSKQRTCLAVCETANNERVWLYVKQQTTNVSGCM
jgi:hypothetical protein